MKATLTNFNAGDFQQRHQRTFGFFEHGPKKLLVYVEEVRSDQCKFSDIDGNPYYAFSDAGVEFEFIPVTRGWFNTSDCNAKHFNRVPARQWQRGISRSNTEIYGFDKAGRMVRCNVDFNTLSKVYENSLNFEEMLNTWLKNEQHVLALSRHFALTHDRVFFHTQYVGKVDKTNKRILLDSDLLVQEMGDILRRNNIDFTVAVNG